MKNEGTGTFFYGEVMVLGNIILQVRVPECINRIKTSVRVHEILSS